jgi:hypothetical protein
MLNRKHNRHHLTIVTVLILAITISGLTGCDRSTPTQPETKQSAPKTIDQSDAAVDTTKSTPPAPPINETFEAAPQLSLFPRAGDVRPEETEERFPYWKTFIEHIVKTSGPANIVRDESKTSWALRGIKTIDSVGYFSPLAVQPATSYQVTFQIKTELAEGASAGIGVLEFSEFLWIGNQFTEAQLNEFVTGSQEGVRLTGTRDWEEQSFTFTTDPQTNMIHLIFFREGEHDRKPVLFDDISITPL